MMIRDMQLKCATQHKMTGVTVAGKQKIEPQRHNDTGQHRKTLCRPCLSVTVFQKTKQ